MGRERRLAYLTLAMTVVLGVATVMVYRTPAAPASVTAAPAALDGATVFRSKGCVVCHVAPGSETESYSIGPDLTGLAARAGDRVEGLSAAEYTRRSILAPGEFKVPGYDGTEMPTLVVSSDELDALVAFLLDDGAR